MPRTETRRPGGRSARVVADVLDAAVAELLRAGFADFRVENVAAQAGVNKTSIYRRWRTRGQVVSAALRAAASDLSLPQETGVLRDDLVALFTQLSVRKRADKYRILSRMAVLEADDPVVKRMLRTLRRDHHGAWAGILRRAIARGELRTDWDPAFLTEMIASTLFMRLQRTPEQVTTAWVEQLVDFVLWAATRPAPDRAPRASRDRAPGPRVSASSRRRPRG